MADDLDVAFQKGLYAALGADVVLAELVGPRIYDRVPDPATFPYLRISEVDAVDRSTGCHVIDEVTATIHAFSRKPGLVEAKAIARAVRNAVGGGFAIEGFDLKARGRPALRAFTDPDGLTAHAVIVLPFHVSPA